MKQRIEERIRELEIEFEELDDMEDHSDEIYELENRINEIHEERNIHNQAVGQVTMELSYWQGVIQKYDIMVDEDKDEEVDEEIDEEEGFEV